MDKWTSARVDGGMFVCADREVGTWEQWSGWWTDGRTGACFGSFDSYMIGLSLSLSLSVSVHALTHSVRRLKYERRCIPPVTLYTPGFILAPGEHRVLNVPSE
eukprot:GHVU01168827.1.p2 GENE.GHVU01168827.1~~GHVU01168827.1.p2  ORF type:complete len:103 (-),score=4.31 GHVU01168827.1:107-415(-)